MCVCADVPLSVGILDPRASPTQLNAVEFLWDPAKRASAFIQVSKPGSFGKHPSACWRDVAEGGQRMGGLRVACQEVEARTWNVGIMFGFLLTELCEVEKDLVFSRLGRWLSL